jgi:hypothetical protein
MRVLQAGAMLGKGSKKRSFSGRLNRAGIRSEYVSRFGRATSSPGRARSTDREWVFRARFRAESLRYDRSEHTRLKNWLRE